MVVSLDRFASGTKDAQEVRAWSDCTVCEGEIYEGDYVYLIDGDCICSESCVLNHASIEEGVAGE